MAACVLQRQSWVAVERLSPKLKIFTAWSFTENICQFLRFPTKSSIKRLHTCKSLALDFYLTLKTEPYKVGIW